MNPCDNINNDLGEAYPKSREWAPIPGFDGYEASDDGHVRTAKGKLLKQNIASNGALQVTLGRATRLVHKLVLVTFTGHPLVGGYRPRHLNGDLSDNKTGNLVWAGKPRT